MTEFTTILFVLIGLIIGFVVGRSTSRAGDAAKLHKALSKTRKELDQYKKDVTEHFRSTAGLLNQFDEQYQRLQQQLAEQNQKLTGYEFDAFRAEAAEAQTTQEPEAENQPLDYSGEPSGLLSDRSKDESR